MRTQTICLTVLILAAAMPARAERCASPKTFRLRPCRSRVAASVDPTRAVLLYRSRRIASEPAHVRVVLGRKTRDVSLTVLGRDGAVIVGPMTVARAYTRLLPAFCGDLNGDGDTDFVVMAQVDGGDRRVYCDVAFALSAKDGHRIVVMRRNLNPGARDFVDLGGRCGFIHTQLVASREPCDRRGHAVCRLFEFGADGRAVASSGSRYPKMVHLGTPGDRGPAGDVKCATAAPLSPDLPRHLVQTSHPVATTVASGDVD